MTFYDFIIGFINDDTPFGSLANYINKDHKFPKDEKISMLFDHMCCLIIRTLNLLKAPIERLVYIN